MAKAHHDPHIRTLKDQNWVYIEINGVTTKMSAKLARDIGDALYKTGCDVEFSREK